MGNFMRGGGGAALGTVAGAGLGTLIAPGAGTSLGASIGGSLGNGMTNTLMAPGVQNNLGVQAPPQFSGHQQTAALLQALMQQYAQQAQQGGQAQPTTSPGIAQFLQMLTQAGGGQRNG